MNELCAARVHSKVPRVQARQPHSIPGAELSDVLIPGFSQLNPDRTLIVDHGVTSKERAPAFRFLSPGQPRKI
jgi:hypothetical protein